MNIGAWHDSSTLQIRPGINIGLQYIRNTSEYIPKLQLHQHSLLARKVSSRHNLSAQVFFSVSSRSLSSPSHFQVIFIWIWIITRFRSSSLDHTRYGTSSLDHTRSGTSSLDHTRYGTSSLDHTRSGTSLDLDHHWIWIIITGSRLSLDLDHHHWTRSGSSLDLDLDLDHLSIWIITVGSGSSLDLDLSESS